MLAVYSQADSEGRQHSSALNTRIAQLNEKDGKIQNLQLEINELKKHEGMQRQAGQSQILSYIAPFMSKWRNT